MYGKTRLAAMGSKRASVTLGVALSVALSVPAVAFGATIKVNETVESATFVHGGTRPADYSDSIKDLSNHDGKCSLREAIEAANTHAPVDGCAAGTGPGDVIELPAGTYQVYDNLFVHERVIIRGANAGKPGNDPHRGPATIIRFDYNPNSQGDPAMFWLGAPSPTGPADGGGSEFNGLTLEAHAATLYPMCQAGNPSGTCEEWAIVQPEKSGGTNPAPGFQLRNSIVEGFTSGVYLGGKGAVIARNLFRNNDALFGGQGGVNSGVDVYSDGTYTDLDPVIVRNVFADPVVAGVELQGAPGLEPVTGGLIRRNLVNMHLAHTLPVEPRTRNGIGLLTTSGQRVQDNVIYDPSPPPLATRVYPYAVFLDTVRNIEISGNTFTKLGTAIRINSVSPPFEFTGVSGVRVVYNRIYGNRYGFRVFLPQEPLSIDARNNWWGANGGAGSTGARPGAPNPVNGVLFENGSPPAPGAIDTSEPLQLECLMPTSVTTNTPVPLTGRVSGMPSVDRAASTEPWFTSIHDPLMAGGVSGVTGHVSGYGVPPSNGVLGGQVVPGGGALTGTLVATETGAGAGDVALDSEQVACPFHAAPGPEPGIGKHPDSPTVKAGGLAGYRITVLNRGRAAARNWWVCDRMPRGMTFVRATRRLRRLGRLRCLVIPKLRPHRRATFHVTARIAPHAASTLTNDAEVIPGPPAGGTPPASEKPIAEVDAREKVRRRSAGRPAPPSPVSPPFTG